ncbi:DUF3293 domain-containing protein [Candidatus Methylopumilus rimovensis]|uniref:DUF3293 domain-containing protein n=1 Tax=Candidatus Methylopumilus rimovensis TaxID=2588535 RepID=A0AAE6FRS1_9PROT|nr:DUF3293 domain-containing protein [Candidatus Methylopumilus rimovensis]QDD12965.1 DUF3293 domain-containing protein [Candidatus Methylopumilus rimovensis]
MTDTSINNELLASYKLAHYHVYGSPRFILKIGQYSPELHDIYKTSPKKIAAFITAFNPASIELSNQENKERNQQLEEKIKTLHLCYLHGEGKCDENERSGEESFLVFEIDQTEAIRLGREFGQNAIVWIPENSIPELLLLK